MNTDSDYQVLYLTEDFYNSYPNPPYTEILTKKGRGYSCLLFQSHYGYFLCVPYRTEVKSKYSYRFKTSKRSKAHKSGLDYSKMVIVKNPDFIGTQDAIVDKDEYLETDYNIDQIKSEALDFLEKYINHINGTKKMHDGEFKRRYGYSPLKYFHTELGLTVTESV